MATPLVTVVDVQVAATSDDRLSGGWLDAPRVGDQSDVHAITIAGWVVGSTCPVVEVLVMYRDKTLRRMRPDILRPDVAAELPHVDGAAACGFKGSCSVLGMLPDFALEICAVLADGSEATIAVVQARRELLERSASPALQPLLVTALGRSGSTWLMRLLSAHPGVVCHRAYPYETRIAAFWAHALRVLSAPANHSDSSHPDDFALEHLWIGHNPFHGPPVTDDDRLRVWIGRTHLEDLAAWCRSQVQAFYGELTPRGNGAAPRYFAEKSVPYGLASDLMFELYPEAREVVLVRDFRDMFASIEAFNVQRGFLAFGRECARDEIGFIRELAVSADELADYWQKRRSRTCLVLYEDLVRRPCQTLSALLEYLGMDAKPSLVAGIVSLASDETAEMRAHRTSPTPGSSIGRWRRDLDPGIQGACEQAFGEALRAFGYER